MLVFSFENDISKKLAGQLLTKFLKSKLRAKKTKVNVNHCSLVKEEDGTFTVRLACDANVDEETFKRLISN